MTILKEALDEWNAKYYRLREVESAEFIITALVEQNRQLREALERAAKPARREFSGNDSHRLDECRAIINAALAATDPMTAIVEMEINIRNRRDKMSIEEALQIIEKFRNTPMSEMTEINCRIWWLAKSTLEPIA